MWNGRFACAESNPLRTMLTNQLQDTLACYTFTLVLSGELLLENNGQQIGFSANDLYVYLPGYPVRILSVSDDYRSIVLLVDEQATYETPAFRNLIRASFHPLMQSGKPKLTLSANDTARLNADIRSMMNHIARPTIFTDETLEMLYSVFILDLIDMQEHALDTNPISRRTEDIFISFYTLVRQHYVAHHDIGYYADLLHISTTYLSRIVKQVTGSTVVEYINQMLATEASWLLTSSSLSISEIAERLHFATTASFDKFFTRMRGKSPRAYRQKRTLTSSASSH
jgi:AraC-like DNA-binding protein